VSGTDRADVVVVGGGIVGLAVAWQLQRRRPDLAVTVVEKEPRVARHQSSHNSGVLHAGIYYPPGSLKARLCRRGKQLVEDYARQRGIDVEHNGKLVVAVDERELPGLQRLEERARANGVPGLRLLRGGELQEVEPAVTGVAALHSPSTGVVDFERVCEALARDVADAGGQVRTGWPVTGIELRDGRGVTVHGPRGSVAARVAVACAGLQSDRVAELTGGDRNLRVVPFRGSWYRLRGPAAERIRGSIYPVPDPRYPFLGVHLTRRIDGEVWVGPNAFLALARERYRRVAFAPRDAAATLAFPGFWRFAAKNLPAAVEEFTHDVSRRAYAAAVARYLPGITGDDLVRGPMGIRAQAMDRAGRMVDDFALDDQGAVLHVRNAPSPAATASLAIAEEIVERLTGRLESA
jgi:L-2-hydroxyglutarate oxidase LhgO